MPCSAISPKLPNSFSAAVADDVASTDLSQALFDDRVVIADASFAVLSLCRLADIEWAKASSCQAASQCPPSPESAVSSFARLTYVRGVHNVLRVLAPDDKQRYLTYLLGVLRQRAKPTRGQRHLLVPPSDMFCSGVGRMRRYIRTAECDTESAKAFSDGLMMATIICKAVRKRNFVGMLRERNIRRNVMDVYKVQFQAVETKARRPFRQSCQLN
jgi:hypothetical protein